jgi:selenoprotein W-related protein
VSLAEQVLKDYEHVIETMTLIPSDGGRFEVSVNGELIFSKVQERRHPETGEVLGIISKMVD